MEGDNELIKSTSFMEEEKKEAKKLKGTSSIRSNVSKSNTNEEIKHDNLIYEDLVHNSGEEYIHEDLELNNITTKSKIPHSNTTTTTIRSESSSNFTKILKIIFPYFNGAKLRLWVEKCILPNKSHE